MSDTAALRGIMLPCPKCGEPDAALLFSLADGETITCQDGGCEFTVDDVRDLLARWAPVLAWLGALPAAPDRPA
mgnify:CR=1 FL=1